MAESLVARNVRTANHRVSTLYLLVIREFLDDEHQHEILDNIVVAQFFYVRSSDDDDKSK